MHNQVKTQTSIIDIIRIINIIKKSLKGSRPDHLNTFYESYSISYSGLTEYLTIKSLIR
jgi:hypothetical protein